MKKLSIVLVCLTIPLQLGASVQNQMPPLAYDFCGPYDGGGGLEILCDIRLVDGDSNTISVMPGSRPAWSPDGLRVAAESDHLAIYDLVSGSTTAFPGTGPVDGPRWSPDNARVAFTSYRDGQAELYVINADGSALTRLTDNVGFRGAFAWSPDGTAIAFGAAVGGVRDLFVMQADGSNPRRLTYDVGFGTHTVFQVAASASWSPDGARIAFDCANDICAINADGTNFIRLTTDPVAAYGPVFSPVDGRIAFVTGRFGWQELAILELNGAVTRLASDIWAGQYAWSADGERLAFVFIHVTEVCPADNSCYAEQGERVFTVGSDGNGLREIGFGHHPRWAPTFPGQPVATFTSNCTGSSCQFDAMNTFDPDGSVASYRWVFGDGTTGSGVTAAHEYATGATYEVKLIVTDNSGAIAVAFRYIRANAPPVASFTATCNGPACTFDASASSDPDGTIVGYGWTFGDGAWAQGPSAAHTYTGGTFLAKLWITDNGGSAAGAETTLTVVNAIPVAAFTIACAALTCTFDASASTDADDGILQYGWDFGNGSSPLTSDTVVTRGYQVAGTYLVTLTVTDRAGQTGTSSQTVTVATPPPPVDMHVGNLTGSSIGLQKTWNALVTVQIHRDTHQAIEGVQVSATWNSGSTATCQTDASGNCSFSRAGIPNNSSTVTLTVTGAVFEMHVYKPASNHDPDGGSNGTTIVVRRR